MQITHVDPKEFIVRVLPNIALSSLVEGLDRGIGPPGGELAGFIILTTCVSELH